MSMINAATHYLPAWGGAITQGARGFLNGGTHQFQLMAEGRLPEITAFMQRTGRTETHVVPSYNEFNANGTAHPYYFLSNFYKHPITYKGKQFHTSEHAFQAHKFENSPHFKQIRKDILSDTSPRQAQLKAWDWGKNKCYDARGNRVGKGNGIDHTDADWHKFPQPHPNGYPGKKDLVMAEVLDAKFSKGPLRQKLIDTGDSLIIEDSPHDEDWAIGKFGMGNNKLGFAQMQLRARLQAEDAQNGSRAIQSSRLPANISSRTAINTNGYNAADFNQAAQGLPDGVYHQEFLKQRAIHPTSRKDAHIATSKQLGIDYIDENGATHYKAPPVRSRTTTSSRGAITTSGYDAADFNQAAQGLPDGVYHHEFLQQRAIHPTSRKNAHIATSQKLGIDYIDENGATHYTAPRATTSSRATATNVARNRDRGVTAMTRTGTANTVGAASHNPGTQSLSAQEIARYNRVYNDNFKTKNPTDSHLAASKALGVSYVKNGRTIYQPSAIASWSQNWFSLSGWMSWIKSFFG